MSAIIGNIIPAITDPNRVIKAKPVKYNDPASPMSHLLSQIK
jgi:hypothetical protein